VNARGCKPDIRSVNALCWFSFISLRMRFVYSNLCVENVLAYLLSFWVQKLGSSTLPYYLGWDFDLHKQVTAERASSIGVCWKTLTYEPRSGPLKATMEKLSLQKPRVLLIVLIHFTLRGLLLSLYLACRKNLQSVKWSIPMPRLPRTTQL